MIRTGLPTVYWRALNQGIPNSKSTTAQVVGQIHQGHTHLGACNANGANEDPTHTVFHVPKDMLDPCSHSGLGLTCVKKLIQFE